MSGSSSTTWNEEGMVGWVEVEKVILTDYEWNVFLLQILQTLPKHKIMQIHGKALFLSLSKWLSPKV